MDSNSNDKVTFKEYIEYCKNNAKTQQQKSDTKVVKTEDGKFKTTSTEQVINSYTQSENSSTEGMFDEEVC